MFLFWFLRYKEIDSLLYGNEQTTKKIENDKKDSSRKNTERKTVVKNQSSTQFTGTKSKLTKRHKAFDFNEEQKPFFRYIISPDDMVSLISRVANFTKKQLEKLDKLLANPSKSKFEKTEDNNVQE